MPPTKLLFVFSDMTKLFSMVCLNKDQKIRSKKKRREERQERIKLRKMARQNYEQTTSTRFEKVPMRNDITNVI